MFNSIDELQTAMEKANYICERSLATSIYLAQTLGKPLLLEGQAGVGKTEVAKVIAEILQTKLIRLQCYDGLDSSHALYEWNYPKQILAIKIAQAQGEVGCAVKDETASVKRLRTARHPMVYLTPADVARGRQNAARHPWARAIADGILAVADEWTAKDDAWILAQVPGKGACFAYGLTGCPICGAGFGGYWDKARASFENTGVDPDASGQIQSSFKDAKASLQVKLKGGMALRQPDDQFS